MGAGLIPAADSEREVASLCVCTAVIIFLYISILCWRGYNFPPTTDAARSRAIECGMWLIHKTPRISALIGHAAPSLRIPMAPSPHAFWTDLGRSTGALPLHTPHTKNQARSWAKSAQLPVPSLRMPRVRVSAIPSYWFKFRNDATESGCFRPPYRAYVCAWRLAMRPPRKVRPFCFFLMCSIQPQPRRPSAASRTTILEESPVSHTFVYWAVLQGI